MKKLFTIALSLGLLGVSVVQAEEPTTPGGQPMQITPIESMKNQTPAEAQKKTAEEKAPPSTGAPQFSKGSPQPPAPMQPKAPGTHPQPSAHP